jgi:hypothetical protein
MFQILHRTAVLHSYYTWKALRRANVFRWNSQYPVILDNKQQTQRRVLLALSQAERMRAALPVTQARPGACQYRVAYIQI